MTFKEFEQFKLVEDKKYPLLPHYIIDEERDFYVEPIFYSQMQGFKERHEDKYDLIVEEVIARAMKNKKTVFVGDFENTAIEMPGYVFVEITDITDPLKIFVEDKSRGSDYGD